MLWVLCTPTTIYSDTNEYLFVCIVWYYRGVLKDSTPNRVAEDKVVLLLSKPQDQYTLQPNKNTPRHIATTGGVYPKGVKYAITIEVGE